jgi:hypothetical protein
MTRVDADQVTDGGNETISFSEPYIVHLQLEGTASMLFHRWNCASVELKAKAAKGSKAKKTDDTESYLYRDSKGIICVPGEYLRQSIIHAAKFKQDPRSPRKSAMDLFKAAVVSLTELASLGVKEPDYLDQRRVQVQRSGITRVRPAMRAGWKAKFDLLVNLPEYVSMPLLREVIDDAGRLIGIADFRPTYGRFVVTSWAPAIK